MRNKKGQFIKGHLPENNGKGGFQKGNKWRFKKGHLSIWNRMKRREDYPQIGFQKGHKYYTSEEGRKRGAEKRKGKNHPKWKGGKAICDGYVYILNRNHPSRNSGNYIAEHRLVMEKYLGRYLKKWEIIHHKNGIRDDNRLKNLEIVVNKKHFGKIRCPKCLYEFLIK